jgi:hypothetical protein
MTPAVAASETWTDPDGFRRPAGDVHAWLLGTNQTLCGLPLHRTGLRRFAGTSWADVQPAAGHADEVRKVCRKCLAATGVRRGTRSWTRHDPRP